MGGIETWPVVEFGIHRVKCFMIFWLLPYSELCPYLLTLLHMSNTKTKWILYLMLASFNAHLQSVGSTYFLPTCQFCGNNFGWESYCPTEYTSQQWLRARFKLVGQEQAECAYKVEGTNKDHLVSLVFKDGADLY